MDLGPGTYWADDEPAIGTGESDLHGWKSLSSRPEQDMAAVNSDAKAVGGVHAQKVHMAVCDA